MSWGSLCSRRSCSREGVRWGFWEKRRGGLLRLLPLACAPHLIWHGACAAGKRLRAGLLDVPAIMVLSLPPPAAIVLILATLLYPYCYFVESSRRRL